SRSACPPPPTIPASSTTSLLLRKAAALGEGLPNGGDPPLFDPAAAAAAAAASSASAAVSPKSENVAAGAGAGNGRGASSKSGGEDPRWIFVHWHTPASLRRLDYCRGPFTPDFVKRSGGRAGYDPFVTKIRKSSVVVTCAGLLSSRCIPEKALRELGV
ncbi:unnamed protein product, partial [Scytosiphon promiscuus]